MSTTLELPTEHRKIGRVDLGYVMNVAKESRIFEYTTEDTKVCSCIPVKYVAILPSR